MARKINKYNALILLFIISRLTVSFAAVGYLCIQVEPGTFTYLDSQLVANQSFENMALSSGSYDLHVYNPADRSWQDRGFKKQIVIQEAETLRFNLTGSNIIGIFTNPANGLVRNDSITLGYTPLVMVNPHATYRYLTILKNGYQNLNFTLEPGKDQYHFNLTPVPSPLLPVVLQIKDDHNPRQWLPAGLILTSLASSWLSFLFKRNADANYERYMHSAIPSNMKKYYNRTLQYDRYAEISFGVSLLSLGGYLYMLFTE